MTTTTTRARTTKYFSSSHLSRSGCLRRGVFPTPPATYYGPRATGFAGLHFWLLREHRGRVKCRWLNVLIRPSFGLAVAAGVAAVYRQGRQAPIISRGSRRRASKWPGVVVLILAYLGTTGRKRVVEASSRPVEAAGFPFDVFEEASGRTGTGFPSTRFAVLRANKCQPRYFDVD
jgi:hypothetical protein